MAGFSKNHLRRFLPTKVVKENDSPPYNDRIHLEKKEKLMNKKNILTVSIVVVIAVIGFMVYRQVAAKRAAAEAPATETALVERGDLSMAIDVSGSLTSRMDISLAFPVGGRVDKVLVVEGQQVDEGQSLLQLDTQDLEWQVEQARLSVSIAEYDLSDARDDYWEESDQVKRAKAKLEQAQVSQQQAEWRLSQAALVAPINGTIAALNVDAGEMANSGQTVIVLSDLSNLKVEVNVDETDVSRLSNGMEVQISVDAFPGHELTGVVTYIEPAAVVQSGVVLYTVTVELNPVSTTDAEQALPLRSGMTVNVTFPIEQRKDTLIVPFRAVETEGGQAYVTRVTASGSERVAVQLGLITDTQVEILSGIDEGDVVTVYANPVQDTAVMHSPIFGERQ
jgi:RND family efflux transporter MFP subunit